MDPEATLRALTSVRRKDYAVGVVLLSLGLLGAQTTAQVGPLVSQEGCVMRRTSPLASLMGGVVTDATLYSLEAWLKKGVAMQVAIEAGRKGVAALRSTSRSLERRQLAAAAQSQQWLERLLAQSKRQAAVSEQSLKVYIPPGSSLAMHPCHACCLLLPITLLGLGVESLRHKTLCSLCCCCFGIVR